ncbi:MAG TPA: SCO family protein [Steroidobacteraceae bacterium]|nr:SCO family protein [Steroidobacteraceae bacterium]
MTPTRLALFAIVLLLAAGMGALVARQQLHPSAPVALATGTELLPPRELPQFSLISHEGRPFERAALQGHWTLMFFGFTHCPGICPMTLTTLADVRKRLHDLPPGDLPQIVLVSLDPERDTPERLAQYVVRFDPTTVGVTGSAEAVDQFAASLGITHRKVPAGGSDYMIDHSAVVLLLDRGGREAAVFSPPHDPEQLSADYRRMLARG